MAIKLLENVGYAKSSRAQKSVNLGIDIYPTFYFNAESEKQQESALTWVNNTSEQYWDPKKTSWITNPDYVQLTEEDLVFHNNKPMKNLYLDDIDVRQEGGRAYKVVDKDTLTYFDVREDQILQAILNHGIQAGGKIGGKWVWAQNGSQVKCLLVGGKEYNEALKLQKSSISTKEKITKGYVVGEVYTDKDGIGEYIYVGSFPSVIVFDLNHFSPPIKAPVILKKEGKRHWFLYHVAKDDMYKTVEVCPNLVDLIDLRTVYKTNKPAIKPNDLVKKVSLVLPNVYRTGESAIGYNCGYCWHNHYKDDAKIKWTDVRSTTSYVADAFLNGNEVLNSIPRF